MFGGDDILNGGAGNDILIGGAGRDLLYGNLSEDLLFGDNVAVTLSDGQVTASRPTSTTWSPGTCSICSTWTT